MKNFKKFDNYGAPVEFNFRGKSSHQSNLGAFCSISLTPFLFFVGVYLTIFFDYESNDVIRSSSIIKAFNDPFEGVYLNHTGQQVNLMFSLYVNDGEFDNDDNPYGRWVLHRYTNMNDIHDENKENYEKGYRDEHIQLEPCQLSSEFDWTSSGVKVYCPAMTSFDFLYGNFYTK